MGITEEILHAHKECEYDLSDLLPWLGMWELHLYQLNSKHETENTASELGRSASSPSARTSPQHLFAEWY